MCMIQCVLFSQYGTLVMHLAVVICDDDDDDDDDVNVDVDVGSMKCSDTLVKVAVFHLSSLRRLRKT